MDTLTREELEKRAREQRNALELKELRSVPTDSSTQLLTAKPGHWLETTQQFKSNREDLQVVAVGSITRGDAAVPIAGTDMVCEVSRRTSLPRGQTKTVDLQYFVPFSPQQNEDDAAAGTFGTKKALNFRTELLAWPLQTPILQSPDVKPANELREHEFVLAVLSPQPLTYEYLSSLDAVYWRGDALMEDSRIRSYFVALVKPGDSGYAFPHSMLTLTSTAVVLWDDVSADDLSTEQQQALVDWLHWGGQLLISGPTSWSRLQNSFLSQYLPARSAESVQLTSDDLRELSDTWSTIDRRSPGQPEPLNVDRVGLSGMRYQLSDSGNWLPGSGQMVAEGRVGRGRIALTAFPLGAPSIYRWKYFSSLLSTGLLRRPARTLERDEESSTWMQVWTGSLFGLERSPNMHTNLRILSRDLPLSNSQPSVAMPISSDLYTGFPLSSAAQVARDERKLRNSLGPAIAEGEIGLFNTPAAQADIDFEARRWGGNGAAWNDNSGLSAEALQTLKAAAGIELPERATIVWLLAGYLMCLVPINWLVFKLIGRLEWAWLAAPLLALVGVAIVTRVARLDIGFARRTTQVAVLELYNDHPRGHLTQFLALYTSLSTNYAIDFPENGSVALPLGDASRARRRAALSTRTVRTNYGRAAGVTLEPLTVYSNSTEMVHAEQVIGLSGGLTLGQSAEGQPLVKNNSGLQLQGALAVRSPSPGTVEYSWLGELASGQSASLTFTPVNQDNLWEHWNLNPSTQAVQPSADTTLAIDELWIGGLLRALVLKTPLVPGQTRLFAYSDDQPGSLQVTPKEDQFDGRCVVVAHLSFPDLEQIQVTPDPVILSRAPLDAGNVDAGNVDAGAVDVDAGQEIEQQETSDNNATGESTE